MRSLRILISGMVQGVNYRYFTKKAADSLGVKGWVRNLPDGRVEALAQAVDEETEKRFIRTLEQGPAYGRVTGIECTQVDDPMKYDSFEIIY